MANSNENILWNPWYRFSIMLYTIICILSIVFRSAVLLFTDTFEALLPFTDNDKSWFTFNAQVWAFFYPLPCFFCSFYIYLYNVMTIYWLLLTQVMPLIYCRYASFVSNYPYVLLLIDLVVAGLTTVIVINVHGFPGLAPPNEVRSCQKLYIPRAYMQVLDNWLGHSVSLSDRQSGVWSHKYN